MNTMTKQEEIGAFLNQHITLPRIVSPYWAHQQQFLGQSRPPVEQVANELLQIAEFRALRLGTWLGTVDGQVITEAVEAVAPPFYRQDIELLVSALTLAAKMQQTEGQDRAGKLALGAIGAAVLVGLGIAGSEASRAA
jgi:hypothetical protein